MYVHQIADVLQQAQLTVENHNLLCLNQEADVGKTVRFIYTVNQLWIFIQLVARLLQFAMPWLYVCVNCPLGERVLLLLLWIDDSGLTAAR